jgi:molybdopterin-biosynthesis enzyme MoeA-like protein
VGPTHDDLTMEGVARAFGSKVIRHPELEALLRGYYGDRLQERNLRMADVPDGARLIYGDPPDPTRWPVIAVQNVYVLPGVPAIFRRKFETVRELFRSGPIHSRAVYSREDEGSIAAALDAVVAEFPLVTVGSYPHFDVPDHKVQITLDGRDREMVERATARVIERLGPAVVRRE